jgi:hypothetical protein
MTPHITLDPNGTGALYCQHCAELYPPALPCTVERWIDQCRGFVLMHKHCPKPQEPSKQVELFDELAKKEREVPIICARCDQPVTAGDALTHLDRCMGKPAGIDGMSDAPDPETDPPGLPGAWIRYAADDPTAPEDETAADDAPLPPPAYSHLAPDEATRLKFLQHYPWPKDSFQLRADLAIVLQRIEGAELPSAATVNGWHPDTLMFQKAAGWVRDELADMNRGEHPEFDPFLPLERQPMPKELAALCMPVKKAKRGARPLANPKPRARKAG